MPQETDAGAQNVDGNNSDYANYGSAYTVKKCGEELEAHRFRLDRNTHRMNGVPCYELVAQEHGVPRS